MRQAMLFILIYFVSFCSSRAHIVFLTVPDWLTHAKAAALLKGFVDLWNGTP